MKYAARGFLMVVLGGSVGWVWGESAGAGATTTTGATGTGTRMAGLLGMGNPALPRTIYTEVILREKGEAVKGDLVGFDEERLTIAVMNKGERRMKWTELTGASAYVLRSRLIDKTEARHWLGLGMFGWGMGVQEQARVALGKARAMDGGLREEVEGVLKSKAGTLIEAVVVTASGEGKVGKVKGKGEVKEEKKEGAPGELFPEVRGK